SARLQASVLDLYDPYRLKQPMMTSTPGSSHQPTDWPTVDQQIVERLTNAARSAQRVRVVTKPIQRPSTRRLLSEFLSAFGNAEHVELDPMGYDVIAEAQRLSYGRYLIPRYRFNRAKTVLSLGADFLGTWLSPVEFAADWSTTRKLDSKNHANQEM